MAVNLKLKKKCNVVPPVWLNLGVWIVNNVLYLLLMKARVPSRQAF